jgi:hypothetical protein
MLFIRSSSSVAGAAVAIVASPAPPVYVPPAPAVVEETEASESDEEGEWAYVVGARVLCEWSGTWIAYYSILLLIFFFTMHKTTHFILT